MNLKDYQAQTSSTAIYPEAGSGSAVALCYLTLGLISELGETCLVTDQNDDNLVHELGDVLWYTTQLANELGIQLATVKIDTQYLFYNRNEAETALFDHAHHLAGYTKKYLRDGELNRVKTTESVENIYWLLRTYTRIMTNMSFNDIAEMNANKLSDRKKRGVLGGSGDHR